MGFYDNYKNRIEKLAKVKRRLHKFRFLICGALLLVVGTVVGLMCAKGAYTSGMSLSAQSVYFNEPYEVTPAKAFLATSSEQHIEYRNITLNGGWTGEKPVKAGEYEARTVTKKIAGYSYSPSVKFEIKKIDAEFTITGDSMTYGDAPAFSVPQLVAGHKVAADELEFNYAQTCVPSTEVNVKESSVKVVDESGDDFTDCYNFTSFSGKTLNVNKRVITISPEKYEFTYDGKAHGSTNAVTEETLAGLAKGDKLTVTTAVYNYSSLLSGGAVNVGEYSVMLESVSLLDGNGKDISGWYIATYNDSTLRINRRPVTVTTGDAEKVYDGEPAKNTKFTADNLADGHAASIYAATAAGFTDVGTYENICEITVTDGVRDVTDNYEITYNPGTLKITPAPLTVTTSTPAAHTYDGQPFTDFTFSVKENLPAKFAVRAVEYMSADTTDAGEYENAFAVGVTLNGEDVTGNFEIGYAYGKLTVNKRSITVTTGSDTKVYDGQPFGCDTPEVVGIAEGQYVQIAENFTVTFVTGAGGVKNNVKYTVYDRNGREVGAKNYDITHVSGTLIIEPLQISVTTATASREYDGTPFANAGYFVTRLNADGSGLVGEDVLTPANVTSLTEADTVDNVCSYTLPTFDGVHSNYEIVGNITYGKLTVEPKKVTVTITPVQAVYGEKIPENGFTLDCTALPNDEELTFTTHIERGGVTVTPATWEGYTLLDRATYDIVANGDKIITGGNANLSNYDFNFVGGSLEILPRGIIVTTATGSHIYDGNDFSDTSYTTEYAGGEGKGLLNGDALTVNSFITVRTIDDIPTPNLVTYAVQSENYYITETRYGTLTITPRPITVELSAIENVTYGETFAYADEPGNYANTPDLAGEEKLKIAVKFMQNGGRITPVNAGIYSAELDLANCVFYNSDGSENEGGAKNYTVTCAPLENLKIFKFEFDIKTLDFTSENGNALTYGDTLNYPDYIGNYSGLTFAEGYTKLPYGEQIKVTSLYYVIDGVVSQPPEKLQVGTYNIRAHTIAVYDQDGKKIDDIPYGSDYPDSNYGYYAELSALEVVPFDLTVTIGDGTAVYGDDVSQKTYSVDIDPATLPYNETFSVLSFKYDREVKDAGEYKVLPDRVALAGQSLGNYSLNFNYGTLTVKPKTLSLVISDKDDICYGDTITPNGYNVYDGDNEYSFADGETLSVDLAYYKGEDRDIKPKNADTYGVTASSITLNGVEVARSEEEHTAGNYIIKVTDGNLTIKPKTVTVVLNDISPVTYGETFSYPAGVNNFANFETIGLEYDEQLEVAVKYKQDGTDITPKNAGRYSAEIDSANCIIYNADGSENADGVANYTFDCAPLENLKINTKTIRIEMDDMSVLYGEFCKVKPDGSYEIILPETHTFKFNEYHGNPEYGDEFTVNTIRFSNVRSDEKITPKDCGKYWLQADSVSVTYWDNSAETLTRSEENWCYFSNYSVFFNFGTLTISPRPVTVTIDDKTAVYGDTLPENSFTVTDGAMQYDEVLSLTYNYDREVKDVGEYTITGTATGVTDGDINNYSVTVNPGTLTVGQRNLNVEIAKDYVATYGEALPTVTANAEGLVYGDTFAVTAFRYYTAADNTADITPRNAGEYGITVKTAQINDKEVQLNSEEGNYYITVTDGLLTIGKADLSIALSPVYSVAYGCVHGYPSGKGNYNSENTVGLQYSDNLELAVEYEVLADNGKTGLVTVGDKSTEIPKNAAHYRILLVAKDSFIHTNDGEKLALEQNYKVVNAPSGFFYIVRRNVYVNYTLSDYTYGETVEKPGFTLDIQKYAFDAEDFSTTELPYGETCDFDFEYEDENGNKVSAPKNAGTYEAWIAKEYVNGKTELAGNYIFRTHYGSLTPALFTINKKAIEITLDDMTATYGDFETTVPVTHTFTPTEGVFEYGDSLTVKIEFTAVGDEATANYLTPQNVGSYSVVAKEFALTYFDGATETAAGDKLKNYIITCNRGTLVIAPKPIHIALSKTAEITYGETAPATIDYTVTSGGVEITRLPYGDPLNVSYHYETTPINAGEYAVIYDGAAINLGSADNYDITADNGLLTVKQRDITVTVYGGEDTYGYEGTRRISSAVTAGSTLTGETLIPAFKFSLNGTDCDPVNAGTYDLVADEDNCKVTGGNALYSNYKVTYVYAGKYKVNPAPLTVRINGDSFTYGERTANVTRAITAGRLFHSDELVLTYLFDGSEEEPIDAGTYAVTASASIEGGNGKTSNYDLNYADNNPQLVIAKRAIEITLNAGGVTSFVYAADYAAAIGNAQITGTVNDERIEVAVIYSERGGGQTTPKNVGEYTATLDFENSLVYDGYGIPIENGINNYELKTACAPVDFEITKMALTVTVENKEITYGDPIPEKLEFSVAEAMPEGESLSLTFSFVQADGSLPVHVKEGGYPVTVAADIDGGDMGNYAPNFTNENPTLTISKKPINITLLTDLGFTYGTPVKYPVAAGNYDVAKSDSLVGDDVLTVVDVEYVGQDGTEYSSTFPPTDAGDYAIKYVSCTVSGSNGDVSGDYDVNPTNGKLTIDGSIITVYTATITEEYNGAEHFTKAYDRYDGDITGYTLVAIDGTETKQTDATDEKGVDNETKFKIVDGDGNDTNNFILRYGPDDKTYGKIIVTPKPVNVTIDNISEVYGVRPSITHTASGLVGDEELTFAVEYNGGAVTPTISGGFFIMPVGTYSMTYLENSASISGGQANASNYAFSFNDNAQFTVTPRHISVTTQSGFKEYDGTPLTKPDVLPANTKWVSGGVEQNVSGLINGETLTPDYVASITDYGENGTAPNNCTYTANGNYVIEKVTPGTLTIIKRTVVAKTADIDVIYDGEPHSDGTVYDINNKLLSGHSFAVTSELVAPVDVTDGVQNKLTVKIMSGETDVTENYKVIPKYGTIKIRKRPLTITTGGVSGVVYDGQPHGSMEKTASDGLLTSLGHCLELDEYIPYTNATDETGVENGTTYKVFCGETDVTGNYDIDYDKGRIIIAKRPVTVALNSGVEVEYGEDYTAPLTENAATLVNGEILNLAVKLNKDITGTGTYTAQADWNASFIINAQGATLKDGINNYAPSFVPASVDFEVTRRNVTVTLNNSGQKQFVYGDNYDSVIKNVSVDRRVAGDTFAVEISYGGETPKYVGNYTATLVTLGNENYNVVACDPVTFDIVAKNLYVTMQDMTIEYGETPAYPDGVKGFTCVGEVGDDVIEVTPAFEQGGKPAVPRYAGNYDIICGDITVNGGAVSADNYNIVTSKKGTLIINGESLVIERLSKEKLYDGTPLEVEDGDYKYYINGVEGAPLIEGCSIVLDGTCKTASGDVSSSCLNEAQYKVIGENAGQYKITYVENGARLEIKPLPFEVQAENTSLIYGVRFDNRAKYSYNLLNGEVLKYREKLVGNEALNVGEHAVAVNENYITFENGAKAENYDLTFKEGVLTVTQRHIMIRTDSDWKYYDGTPLTNSENYSTFLVIDGKKQVPVGLVNGDTLDVIYPPASQTEVGSCYNACTYSASDNYFIESGMYEYGILEVKKTAVTVKTGDINETYSGLPYSNGSFTCDTTLPAGLGIERATEPKQFTAAVSNGENKFGVKIVNAEGDDVSENYNIKYVYGKVNIAKAPLTVTLDGTKTSFDYGDSSFDAVFANVTVSGLVGGDELTAVKLKYSTADESAPANAGTYTVELDKVNSVIKFVGEGNGIDNYAIDCTPVTFTINRLKITVSPEEWTDAEYDGKEHSYSGSYTISSGALAAGESISGLSVKYCSDDKGTTSVGTPENAGTYYVFIDASATTVSDGKTQLALSRNYDVTAGYTVHKITPKSLVITLGNAAHTYDGKAYDYKASGKIKDNLCDGDEIEYTLNYSSTPVNKGDYTVTLENLKYSDNYTFDDTNSRLSCTLTVAAREINVTVADRDVERGNEKYSVTDITSSAADGGDGFVGGDLAKATVTFTYTDNGGNQLAGVPDTVGNFTVGVTFGGDVMNNYSVTPVTKGKLTVTERRVLVTPVYNGEKPFVYDGNAIDESLFGYTHVHNYGDDAENGVEGFTAEDAAKFTITRTFYDYRGKKLDGAPVDAGSYSVKITLSGAGLDGYLVEYVSLGFTVAKRPLSYAVEAEGGEFVYGGLNVCPVSLTDAKIADGYDGFINGNALPDYTFELFNGETPVTSYGVGTYMLKIKFAGMENYEIKATGVQVKIVPRTLVIIPKDPYGGVAKKYDGNNLKLKPDSYTVKSGTKVAASDTLTVTSNEIAPTAEGGRLSITGFKVVDTDSGKNVTANYTVYYAYDRQNDEIRNLDLNLSDFSVKVSYEIAEIHYTLGEVGKTVPYTGNTVSIGLDASAITLVKGTLYEGHKLSFTRSNAVIPAEAGKYPDLIKDLVCVSDGNDYILSIYNLVCDDATKALITVEYNVVSVNLDGLSASTLTVGTLDREVTFAKTEGVCKSEVYVYDIDGDKIIGITLFNGAGADVSANYHLDANCVLSGAEVKILTLAEAERLKRPAIGVEIYVTKEQLASGRGRLYEFDGKGRWVLKPTVDGVTNYKVTGTLAAGHELQVLVFKENGEYLLGVSICSVTDGKRSEASGSYRLRDIVSDGVAARYVELAEASTLVRELYIDFNGAFNADGTVKEEGGFVTGYSVKGLNLDENHVLEITAEKVDGKYVLTAVIYQNRRQGKYSVADRYEIVSVNLPAGAQVVKGTVN